MHRGLGHWMSVCVLGIAGLVFAAAPLGVHAGDKGKPPKQKPDIGDKKGDDKQPAKEDAGIKVLDIASELTDKDGRDTAANDCYAKTFKIKQGVSYQIDMRSKDFDAYLRLEDAQAKQVAEDDDSGGDLNARIIHKAGASGEYQIIATTFAANTTGKFTLTVVAKGGDKEGPKGGDKEGPKGGDKKGGKGGDKGTDKGGGAILLKIDDGKLASTDSKDGDGKFFKVYTVKLVAGNAYRIYMKGNAQVDAFVRLQDETGKLIREDDFGNPNDSGINFTADKTASYKIVATTYKGGMTGTFTLRVTQEGGKTPPVVAKDGKITFQPNQPTVVQGAFDKNDPKDGQEKHFKAYSFQAKAGKSYRFEVAGQGGLDPFVRLEDPNGKLLKEEEFGDGKISKLAFTPTQVGTYKIIATTFKPGITGKFTLTANEDSTGTPPPIAVGKAEPIDFGAGKPITILGKVAATDPKDTQGKFFKAYSFQAQTGKVYKLELAGQGGFDPELRIENAEGQMVKNEDFGDGKLSRLQFSTTQPGTYRVIATSYKAGATGDFTLSASMSAQKISVVEMPGFQKVVVTEVVGQLTNDDGVDDKGNSFKVYTFKAQADKMYKIEMNGRTFDAQLRLEDANSKSIKGEDFFDGRYSQLFVPAGKGGVLRVIATTAAAKQLGTFSLSITELVPKKTQAEDVTFERVSRVNGKITNQDGVDNDGKFHKVYTLKTLPGMSYRCEMTGKPFPAVLRLEDANGKLVQNEDSFDLKANLSRLAFHADKAATYRLIATTLKAGQTGDFTLTIAEIEKTADKGGPITKSPIGVENLTFQKGQPTVIKGQLTAKAPTDTQGKHFKLYAFKAEQGKSYSFEVAGVGTFDPYVQIQDPKGTPLKEEDYGDGKLSRLVFKAPQTGTYHAVATSFKKGLTGEYTLTASELDAKGGKDAKAEPIKLDKGKATINASLTKQDATENQGKHYKAYALQAQAGSSYRIEMAGKDSFDPLVRVEDQNGQVLKEEDFGDGKVSRLVFNPAKAGTYRIIATTFKAGITGDYTLNVALIEVKKAVPAVLMLNKGEGKASGSVTNQDGSDSQGKLYKSYAFQADKGKMYRFEVAGLKGFDPYVRIEDPNGKVLKEEDFGDGKLSRLFFKAEKPGAHIVIVTSFQAGMTGEYALTASEIEAKEAKPSPLKLVLGKAVAESDLNDKDGLMPSGAALKAYKIYTFTADAGKTYKIDLHSKAFDAYLYLKDNQGNTLAENDDNGESLDSRIIHKIEKAGTYQVFATSLNGGNGPFILTIAEFVVKQGKVEPLKLNQGKAAIQGKLTKDDGSDLQGKFYKAFAFQTDKDKTYRFELTGGQDGLDPFIRIEDDKGQHLKEEDFGDGKLSRLFFKPAQLGTYRAIVTTFKPGAIGEFNLTVEELEVKSAKPMPLKFEKGKAVAAGELSPIDAMLDGGKFYHVFTFMGEVGKTYKIDLHSKDFDAYLYLKDDNGKTLDENDDNGESLDSRIIYKVEKAGTYHIIATSLGGGRTGKFVLTVGAPNEVDKLKSTINEILANGTPQARAALVKDLSKHFAAQGAKLTFGDASIAQRVANDLELSDKQLAAEAFNTFGKLLSAAADPDVAQKGKLLLGAGKRLTLVGQAMLVKGTTLEGKEFDLTKLKGKVVLVDFWATWCGPCKAELPNVKKNYEKFHKQGFEVIGISLDNTKTDLTTFLEKEKLPWSSIFEQANNLADDYGVSSIPLAILVGRDGRVISLNARGAELDRLLAEQFSQ